jgi:hypothetical protein
LKVAVSLDFRDATQESIPFVFENVRMFLRALPENAERLWRIDDDNQAFKFAT